MQPEYIFPGNARKIEDKEVTPSDLFDLVLDRAIKGVEVPTGHLPGVHNQYVAALTDPFEQTDFHIIASGTSDQRTIVQLAWHSKASVYRWDDGIVTLTRGSSGDVTVKGSIFNNPMMDGMFHKFGLLWAPRFEKNAHGKPEPVNQDDLQEVYARLSHSRVDKETQRDTATRLEYLYAINDPKTPALTKLRFYNTGKVTDLFTDNELNAFAPRGYKEVKSILFPIRTRLEHLGQLAQAVQEAIRLAPLMLLDQMAADLRNEEAKERKDEGHHGH